MKSKINLGIVLPVIAILLISVIAYLYFESDKFSQKEFPYSANVAGIEVYSKIPISEFQNKKAVFLFETQDKIATTCNFEISAVSTPERRGYEVYIERKPVGVYIDNNSAHIQGETDEELLKACHVFLCLRGGIECPENLMEIQNITLNSRDMILVLDNKTGAPAVRGYAELLGVLGFIQAQIVDADKNGIIEQDEVDKNDVWIYPYVMEDDLCKLQPFKSVIEILNITNDTTECDFRSGIFLERSDKNEIRIEGDKVIISGDDEHIHTGAVIVRDILSPEWIRVYYGLE